MALWPKTIEGIAEAARAYMRRHWQQALQVRQRLFPSEDAFHLLMAAGVGVLGGLVNLLYYWAVEGAQSLFSSHLGRDLTTVAMSLDSPSRVLIPTLGGLGAGLVLYWGFRFAGKYRTTNLLEVVVATRPLSSSVVLRSSNSRLKIEAKSTLIMPDWSEDLMPTLKLRFPSFASIWNVGSFLQRRIWPPTKS